MACFVTAAWLTLGPFTVLAQAPTEIVLSSKEPIAAPFPSADNLPKTISFDTLTEAEIQQIRKDIVVAASPPERIADNCMQWIFVRNGKKDTWRPVGAVAAGSRGIVKMNGAFRHTMFGLDMEYQSGFMGRQSPSKEPGGGGVSVQSFTSKKTFAHFLVERDSDDMEWFEIHVGKSSPSLRTLSYGVRNGIVVETQKMQCSYLKATCRRYSFPLRTARWAGYPNKILQEQEFGVTPGLNLEMGIEDMCPYDRGAMLEHTINTRIEGKGGAIRKYGFPNNPKLIEAIKPYL